MTKIDEHKKFIEDFPIGFLRAQADSSYKLKHFDIDTFIYQGSELAHYTNLNGLLGIIESNGLWLSDHRFLNDSEEYHNGKLLVLKLLDRVLNKKRYHHFKKILQDTINELKEMKENIYYVCSFSTQKDNLDQWKGYALNDDGIAIVFENNTNQQSFGHFCMLPMMTPSKVIYSDLVKCKILLRTIRKYAFEYKKDKNEKRYEKNLDEDWARELAKHLSLEFINFKNSSYQSESEIRLAITGRWIEEFTLKHRVSNNRIIPYINLSEEYTKHMNNEKLPIKEIIVGPISKQNIMIKSIEEYLKNMGYNSVKVTKSQVPYRG